MLDRFNKFIEKWMAFVTPLCLLVGVCFPDIAKHGLPYVTYVFAFYDIHRSIEVQVPGCGKCDP